MRTALVWFLDQYQLCGYSHQTDTEQLVIATRRKRLDRPCHIIGACQFFVVPLGGEIDRVAATVSRGHDTAVTRDRANGCPYADDGTFSAPLS